MYQAASSVTFVRSKIQSVWIIWNNKYAIRKSRINNRQPITLFHFKWVHLWSIRECVVQWMNLKCDRNYGYIKSIVKAFLHSYATWFVFIKLDTHNLYVIMKTRESNRIKVLKFLFIGGCLSVAQYFKEILRI